MFASLSALTSVFGPSIDHDFENTDVIFLPLCSIVANILSVQRYRAKGRYSILFATLQGLMNLLFLPKVIGRRKIDSEIYPPWLRERKVWTVSKEAGLYYCRLLTMLCDPTTSSVRMNRKTDQLSSATAAARKAVEPHVPVLLKHYIGLSLTHSLPQEVRSAITPGLYAMFDVMQPSTLRSLNLSLDNPGRVLFKSLYEDWSKFGKWKE